jgi:hypothetical protein
MYGFVFPGKEKNFHRDRAAVIELPMCLAADSNSLSGRLRAEVSV